jgi:hypothetical protein
MAQVVEHLTSKHKSLSSNSGIATKQKLFLSLLWFGPRLMCWAGSGCQLDSSLYLGLPLAFVSEFSTVS